MIGATRTAEQTGARRALGSALKWPNDARCSPETLLWADSDQALQARVGGYREDAECARKTALAVSGDRLFPTVFGNVPNKSFSQFLPLQLLV